MKLPDLREAKTENIYKLEGLVPIRKATPFGLQHVLAMFVSNITPVLIISGTAVYNGRPFSGVDQALLLQSCMLVAGLATMIQLYPIWKIGSGLPVVMGISFTFLSVCLSAAAKDYGIMTGGIIAGGIFEGILGLTAGYWKRLITPLLSSCVVVAVGLSILNVGVSSIASSKKYPTGSWQNLLVALITLAASFLFLIFLKGAKKQLYVLFGLMTGYIVSIFFGMVDFSAMGKVINEIGIIAIPRLFAFKPSFDIKTIISFCVIFAVSAVETVGDTTAVCTEGVGRDITDKEISGSLCADGFMSAVSGGVFGCSPVTSYSQNVGLLSMTHVINRFCILLGALALILGGLIPPIGAFFATLPDCVLGGCTCIMFGSILITGIKMMHTAGLDSRNTLIAATSICLGVGVTQVDGFFDRLPALIGQIFADNMVAGVFITGLVMELLLPKDPALYDVENLDDTGQLPS